MSVFYLQLVFVSILMPLSGLSGMLYGKLSRRPSISSRRRVPGRVTMGRRERKTIQTLERAIVVVMVVAPRNLVAATVVARRENWIQKILLTQIVPRELIWSNSTFSTSIIHDFNIVFN